MPYLPPEMWMMVIELMEYQQDFANLCRVSKVLNALCTSILYEDPITPPTTAAFFRTLTESPHLASQVKMLREDFDDFSMKWKDLSPPVMAIFRFHIHWLEWEESTLNTGSSISYSSVSELFDSVRRREAEEDIPAKLCQSVLMSLLPNLEEARLRLLGKMFLTSTRPGALAKLKNMTITDGNQYPTSFLVTNFQFLAEAATALENLSMSGFQFDMTRWAIGRRGGWLGGYYRREFHTFATVTNLNISGSGFDSLEKSASFFILSFPVLESFRFDGLRQVHGPCQPKIHQLLRALICHAPRLKHFCLGGAISIHSDERSSPQQAIEWRQTIKALSQLESLETLNIDTDSLWPVEDEDTARANIPESLFLDCLPQSLHHLHIYDDGDEDTDGQRYIPVQDLTRSFRKLAQAISKDEDFNYLKLVSFSVLYPEGDISEVVGAMEGAGVQAVRQEGPWNSDGLYEGI